MDKSWNILVCSQYTHRRHKIDVQQQEPGLKFGHHRFNCLLSRSIMSTKIRSKRAKHIFHSAEICLIKFKNLESCGWRPCWHQNRSISESYILFSLECWFSQLSKLAHNLETWGVVSSFAFATLLTDVSIVPRVHHGEDHNAWRLDVIVAFDKRIDLMWIHKDNACFSKLKL